MFTRILCELKEDDIKTGNFYSIGYLQRFIGEKDGAKFSDQTFKVLGKKKDGYEVVFKSGKKFVLPAKAFEYAEEI